MKKSKFTDAQILFALKQAETGVKVEAFLPEDGYLRSDLLYLEEKVQRPGC